MKIKVFGNHTTLDETSVFSPALFSDLYSVLSILIRIALTIVGANSYRSEKH